MTFRSMLFSAIVSLLALIPLAVELVTAGSAWWAFLAGPVLVAAPILFGRVLPALSARRWVNRHGLEVSSDEMALLSHLAAHSGLRYENTQAVLVLIRQREFFVSRERVAMLQYLEADVFRDKQLCALALSQGTDIPASKYEDAVASGADADDIYRRHARSGTSIEEVLDSFTEGMPEDYFLAMVGG